MKEAHKKRPPRATANSPPVLADMGKLLYKSVKFSLNRYYISPVIPINSRYIQLVEYPLAELI